jgi:hypothetical protein
MPLGLVPACISPTRLADGFGHAQVALFDILISISKFTPVTIFGSPVFQMKIRHYIKLHPDYKLYLETAQSPVSHK